MVAKEHPGTLLLVEHPPPVITMGKRGDINHLKVDEAELKEQGIDVNWVGRGGDVTYHGPGQIVGYPIMNLRSLKIKVKDYVGGLEEMMIQMLSKAYGIEATSEPGKYTGVWIGNKKITAIGVEIKRQVTMHGFAFNVNSQLEHFDWIVPCGLEGRGVTSLQALLGKTQDMEVVKEKVVAYFLSQFDLSRMS